MHPDQRLLRAIVSRRAGADAEFVSRYRRLAVGLAIRRFGLSELEAEEVFQSLVVRLWSNDFRALRAWRGEGRLSTYLAVIVARLCMERVREGQRAAGAPGTGSEADDRSVEHHSVVASHLRRERASAVRAALGELSAPHRLALMLRFEGDRSSREVGRILGIGAGAARKRVFDAKRRLRRILLARYRELFVEDGTSTALAADPPGSDADRGRAGSRKLVDGS